MVVRLDDPTAGSWKLGKERIADCILAYPGLGNCTATVRYSLDEFERSYLQMRERERRGETWLSEGWTLMVLQFERPFGPKGKVLVAVLRIQDEISTAGHSVGAVPTPPQLPWKEDRSADVATCPKLPQVFSEPPGPYLLGITCLAIVATGQVRRGHWDRRKASTSEGSAWSPTGCSRHWIAAHGSRYRMKAGTELDG